MADIELHGMKELHQALQEFAPKIEANIMRGAMRAGCAPFAKLAKEKVPKDSRDLEKSIRISGRLSKGKAMAKVVAGNKVAYYAHMVEFGTASFYTGTGRTIGKPYRILPKRKKALAFAGVIKAAVTHPGARPSPFMRPAFDEGIPAAIEAARVYIEKRLAKEYKKR